MTQDVVRELYQRVLGREADEVGLKNYVDVLERREMTVIDVVAQMIRSAEFSENFRRGFTGNYPLLNSVAQYDELYHLFGIILKDHFGGQNYVVDCGARGRDRSNSFDLMKFFGWKGLLIEANPALIGPIREEFTGLDFELVNCAVSDTAGKARLTLGINDDVSSIEAEFAAAWGETRGEVEVEMRRLPAILDEHKVPRGFPLLSLDVEGQDLRVLNDLIDNSEYRPRYVIIEASYSFQTKALTDLALSPKVVATYEIAGQTDANLILRLSRK